MKKKKFTIIMIVLLLAVALFFILLINFSNTQIFNQRIFLLKHSTYFILITLVTVALLYLFYNLIKQNYLDRGYNVLYLKIFTLVIFTVTLLISSSIRINYIKKYETPIVTYFVLYDDYNNRIYDSTLKRSDIDIQVIEKTDDQLTLEVKEESTGLTHKYEDGEAIYEIPIAYESRSLIDIMYNANNKITRYIIKQEFIEESNDSGDISVSQSSRIFIMNNQYTRYSFTSSRKSSIIENTGSFEGYYDFNVGELSEKTISASYDEDYSLTFYLSDELIIPLHIKANNDINFTYPPINYSGAIDDFGFIEFDEDSIVTLLNSPHYRRGEYIEYTLKKDLYLINSIEDTYHQAPSIDFTYQENINDAYLIGTMYDDDEISEYIQIDATTFGYKSTYFRYLDKNTSSFEMKWLFEQTPTYAGEVGVNIYFNYHEIFYNNYSKKDYHYILFEENPIFELLN